MGEAAGDDDLRESPLFAGLQVGAATGATGLVFGGVTGVLRSPTPVLWAIATSLQWGLLGGTYWGFRKAILDTQIQDEVTPNRRVFVSGVSGALSFAVVGGLTRGRQNVIPGTIMGTLFGVTGQASYNFWNSWRTKQALAEATPNDGNSKLKKILSSSWSPVKMLSNEDYAKILNEKLLGVDADIALIDEEIESLRKQKPQDKEALDSKANST